MCASADDVSSRARAVVGLAASSGAPHSEQSPLCTRPAAAGARRHIASVSAVEPTAQSALAGVPFRHMSPSSVAPAPAS